MKILPRLRVGRFHALGAALIVAAALVGFVGHGVPGAHLRLQTGQAWLSNAINGTATLVDGYSGQIISQARAESGPGAMTVVNGTDGAVIVDANGNMNKIDNSTYAAGQPKKLFSNTTAAVGSKAVYAVDEGAGKVQQLDAASASLTPVGAQVDVGAPISAAVVDQDGILWASVSSKGVLARISTGHMSVVGGVASPGDGMTVVLAATHVVAADLSTGVLTPIGFGVPAHLPRGAVTSTASPLVVGSDTTPLVAVISSGEVFTVDLRHAGQLSKTSLPQGIVPSSPVMTGSDVDLLNRSSGDILIVHTATRRVEPSVALPHGRADQLVLRDGLVFVNDSESDSAMVIEQDGSLTDVTKFTAESTKNALAKKAQQPPKQATLPPTRSPAAPPAPGTAPAPGNSRGSSAPPSPGRTLAPTVPGPPINLQGAPGNQKINLTWSAAQDNAATIDHYNVAWSQGGSTIGSDTVRARPHQTTSSFTIPNLENGIAYTATVTAHNSVGDGPRAQTLDVTPTNSVPDPPIGVTASVATPGQAVVAWTAPQHGYGIANYTITAAPSGQSPRVVASGAPGNASGGTVTITTGAQLPVGLATTFTVVAVAASGSTSDSSQPSNAVTPYGSPQAPGVSQPASSSDGSSASVQLSCDATCQQGAPVTSYAITVPGSGASDQPNITPQPDGSASITVNHLARYSTYTLNVTATTKGGTSSPASVQFNTEGVPQPVNAYDNYGGGAVGHAMCRGNPNNSLSMPGGTGTQTFNVPNGVAQLTGATVQIDPDSTVIAHATLSVGGASRSTTATAAGDTVFNFGSLPVSPGQNGSLTIAFTATTGKIITLYTTGSPGGTFMAANSCPDGAPNVSTSAGLRAVISGLDH